MNALLRLLIACVLALPFTRARAADLSDLVAVRDGEPAAMLQKGLAALGGMKRFVKTGQTVLVKPNIGWDKKPEEAANTNPDLVSAVIKEAYAAGAKKVVVFDHTCNDWEDTYKNSGIAEAVKTAKGEIVSGDDEKSYKTVTVKGATALKEVKIHELYLSADVVINVPILKHHSSTRMTAALKNLMGVIWDRQFWHREDLMKTIAEFPLTRKPDLNILDAYRILTKGGPRGVSKKDVVLKKMLLLSTDMVLLDTAAAKILDMKPGDVPYIGMAAALGIGSQDLAKAKIERISL